MSQEQFEYEVQREQWEQADINSFGMPYAEALKKVNLDAIKLAKEIAPRILKRKKRRFSSP